MDNDLISIKLYVASDGVIWYINADGPPTCSRLGLIEFLQHPLCAYPRLRLISVLRNIDLILACYLQNNKKNDHVVEICSPRLCRTRAELENPERALLAMRQFDAASSLGGWHIMRKHDYATYALASYMQKHSKITDYAIELLKAHPVWPALSFIPTLNIDACCYLIPLILDPRWYIDPRAPTRGSKLRAFLGLDHKTILGLLGQGKSQKYEARCRLVLSCWWIEKVTAQMLKEPSQFLWRIFSHNSISKGTVLGTLRASQAFIEYVRLTWLGELANSRHQLEPLFVPNYFFNSIEESKAYNLHILNQYRAV